MIDEAGGVEDGSNKIHTAAVGFVVRSGDNILCHFDGRGVEFAHIACSDELIRKFSVGILECYHDDDVVYLGTAGRTAGRVSSRHFSLVLHCLGGHKPAENSADLVDVLLGS